MQAKKSPSPTVAREGAPAAHKAATSAPAVAHKPAHGAAKAASAVPLAVEADKDLKDKKVKLVRDSISIPKNEYEVLAEMKLRAGKLGVLIKKTELLRAGIKALDTMSDADFLVAVRAVPSLKTGRPAKTD
jgi:hypothetical protein